MRLNVILLIIIIIESSVVWTELRSGIMLGSYFYGKQLIVYVILTVEYGRNENIHIITSDNPLYFVMRREASNDKIQWIIGYIPWPKGMEYITKMNEWMIPNKIFWTSRIKIWIHTKWSEQSRGPAKAACGPGPRDCSLHEVWIHIFMRDVQKILWGIIHEFIFVW